MFYLVPSEPVLCARQCTGTVQVPAHLHAGDAGIQCKHDSSFKDLGIWPHRATASTLAITGQSDKCYENKVLMGQ